MNQIKINEIFFSIQGESTHAGRPCIFIRTSGCPLRCNYCDTKYAYYEGEMRTVDQIMSAIEKFPTRLVEVTGGEPLVQPHVNELFEALLSRGYEVLCETSGAYPIWNAPSGVKMIVDMKTPSSTEMGKNLYENLHRARKGIDEVKFVVRTSEDFEFAESTTREFHLIDRGVEVLVSPVFTDLTYKDLATWILESGVPFRMQIQMHKHIYDPNARGV